MGFLGPRWQQSQIDWSDGALVWRLCGIWPSHVGPDPAWTAGVAQDRVSSSLLRQPPGVDPGQGGQAGLGHAIRGLRPASLGVSTLLSILHEALHQAHQLLLGDVIAPKARLEVRAAAAQSHGTHHTGNVHHPSYEETVTERLSA